MPVVPIRTDAQQQPPPPPSPVYTLMAAAQMHREGRLIAPDQTKAPVSAQIPKPH